MQCRFDIDALTSVVSLKAGQGVRFYGYQTGRHYSCDVRGCNFGQPDL